MKIMYILLLALMGSSLVVAESFSKSSKRSETWEIGFLVNHVDDWDVNGRNGSGIEVDSNTGWGFTIGYNFNEHFNLAFEYTHNEQDYEATIVPEESEGVDPFAINHELDNDSFTFNFTYNILAKTFTPYVTAGLGWNYLDSNVSDSDYEVYCWWDPWWGYVCDDYYSTYSDTAFSYSLGAGLRWEPIANFILKASVNQRWIDVDSAGDTPEMQLGKLEFIWKM